MLVVLCAVVSAFKPTHVVSRTSTLRMGGGRSPAETKGAKGGSRQTDRSMFKELRQKLNTAAEQPGFFDGADGKAVRAPLLGVN